MCFGGGGPTQAEKQTSVDQRLEADQAARDAAEKAAQQKKEDIQSALESRSKGVVGGRSGAGPRSLFQSKTGGGFLGRFG